VLHLAGQLEGDLRQVELLLAGLVAGLDDARIGRGIHACAGRLLSACVRRGRWRVRSVRRGRRRIEGLASFARHRFETLAATISRALALSLILACEVRLAP